MEPLPLNAAQSAIALILEWKIILILFIAIWGCLKILAYLVKDRFTIEISKLNQKIDQKGQFLLDKLDIFGAKNNLLESEIKDITKQNHETNTIIAVMKNQMETVLKDIKTIKHGRTEEQSVMNAMLDQMAKMNKESGEDRAYFLEILKDVGGIEAKFQKLSNKQKRLTKKLSNA